MKTFKPVIILFLFPVFAGNACAQSSAVFQSLLYPRSVSSQGLGEQGVVSRSPIDAMEYNPANLVYADGVSASYFRNPGESWWGNIPLSSLSFTTKIKDLGHIGLEYTDRDFGTFTNTMLDPASPQGYIDIATSHMYEQSFAAGYAAQATDELAIGVQVRYAKQVVWQITLDHLLFSAGAAYSPEIFSSRLNIGLSFMNFGTKVEYQGGVLNLDSGRVVSKTLSAPTPAQLILGIEGLPVANEFFELDLMAGAMKPLDKVGGAPDYEGESSFEALFNNWNNFPNDVTGQLGLGYIWHPIYLGGGISYVQEMYAGYFTTGPKAGYYAAYTHGFNVGIEACGIKAMVGYAGLYHNSIEKFLNSPLEGGFPWETFEFALSADPSLLLGRTRETLQQNSPRSVIVSGGYSYNAVIGRMNEQIAYYSFSSPDSDSYSDYSEFSLQADFYLGLSAAIVSSFSYARYSQASSYANIDNEETLSLSSGFRYHPIDAIHPFFVQASLGVIRINPIENTSPKYFYQTFTDLSIGGVFHVIDPEFTVIPCVGLKTIIMDAFHLYYGTTFKLAGYNQIHFGLNFGYEL